VASWLEGRFDMEAKVDKGEHEVACPGSVLIALMAYV
jgi:hypothetical protein